MKSDNKTKKRAALSCLLILIMILAPLIAVFPLGSSASEVKIDDKLPEIHINTESGNNPGRDDNSEYFAGEMKITLNNYYKDCVSECTESFVSMGIRTRGNSTRTFAGAVSTGKFSYKIKLDKKEDLFGMGASKHWILLSNIYDPTYMRNKTAYELARAMGLTYCDSTWVVLYLNGEYRGLYQFCESIRVSKSRVDITDWDDIIDDISDAIAKKENLTKEEKSALKDGLETDMRWTTSGTYKNYKISDYYTDPIDITGGYIIEYDSFDNQSDPRPYLFSNKTTSAGVMLKVDTPQYYYTNSSMKQYVRQLISDFEEAVLSPTFHNSKGKHYSEYMDMDSLVNFWVLQTVVKNGEFGIRSMFLYIEDGKLYWGPVWDFDCGAGNHLTVDTGADGWNGGGNRNQWYHALYGDPYFTTLVQERYADLRDTITAAIDSIEIYRGYIATEAQKDLDKYGPHGFNTMSGNVTKSFKEEYDFYLQWQKNRIKWLDSNLLVRYPNIGGEGPYNSSKLDLKLYYKGGGKLDGDGVTGQGVRGDYKYLIEYMKSPTDLTFTLSTAHTTCVKIGMYINGLHYNDYDLSQSSPVTGTISKSDLCLSENAVNTVYIVVYNSSKDIYNGAFATIRVTDQKNPSADQYVVEINRDPHIVDRDSEVCLPSIKTKREGVSFSGWTEGSGVYTANDILKITKNISFYEKWSHTDGLAILEAEKTPIILGNAVINGGSFPHAELEIIKHESTETAVTAATTTTKTAATTTKPSTTKTEPVTTTRPVTESGGGIVLPDIPIGGSTSAGNTTAGTSAPGTDTTAEGSSGTVSSSEVQGSTAPVSTAPGSTAPGTNTGVSSSADTGGASSGQSTVPVTDAPGKNTDPETGNDPENTGDNDSTPALKSALIGVWSAVAAVAVAGAVLIFGLTRKKK